jgi:hypothetical protein
MVVSIITGYAIYVRDSIGLYRLYNLNGRTYVLLPRSMRGPPLSEFHEYFISLPGRARSQSYVTAQRTDVSPSACTSSQEALERRRFN